MYQSRLNPTWYSLSHVSTFLNTILFLENDFIGQNPVINGKCDSNQLWGKIIKISMKELKS